MTGPAEPPSEPFAAVHADAHLEGEPGLDADVHEAEAPVEAEPEKPTPKYESLPVRLPVQSSRLGVALCGVAFFVVAVALLAFFGARFVRVAIEGLLGTCVWSSRSSRPQCQRRLPFR